MTRLRTLVSALVLAAGAVMTTAPAATAAAPRSCPESVRFGGLDGQKTYAPDTFCLFARSSNRDKYFVFQADGNLVYYYTGRALWASNTAGRGAVLVLQGDGNAVIYDAAGRPIWATMTVGIGITTRRLVMQYDGNVVLYQYPYGGNNQRAVWATGTNGRG